jgi:hypothetical protein
LRFHKNGLRTDRRMGFDYTIVQRYRKNGREEKCQQDLGSLDVLKED